MNTRWRVTRVSSSFSTEWIRGLSLRVRARSGDDESKAAVVAGIGRKIAATLAGARVFC